MATETLLTENELQKNLAEAKKNLVEAKRKFTEARLAAQKKRKRKKDFQRKNSEMDDARLCEISFVWHALFGDHVAEFAAFDPDLNAAFALAWLQKIEDFEGHETDETMMDELQDKTQTLEEKTEALLKLVDHFEYFVKRAFPNDARKMEEFAFEQFRKPVASYIAHVALTTLVLLRLSDDYTAELAAAGMPATLPNDIDDALEALSVAEGTQEYTKRLRIRSTTKRIKMFNELWAIHMNVKNAAAIVFRSKPVVAEQFA